MNSKKYYCDICFKIYDCRQNLYRHNTKFHNTGTKCLQIDNSNIEGEQNCNNYLFCNVCNKSFKTKKGKKKHEFKCEENRQLIENIKNESGINIKNEQENLT